MNPCPSSCPPIARGRRSGSCRKFSSDANSCQPRRQYRRVDGIRNQRAYRATIANVNAVIATAYPISAESK